MNQFDGGLPAFDTGKEFPFKTVKNLTNSPIQEETPGSQKSSKKSEGEGINIKVCGQKGYSRSIKNHIERIQKDLLFLAVHNSSIGDLVTQSLTQSVTFTFDITE